jgi:hypothetical protein
MVSAPTPAERRCRATEFMFSDIKSQLAWMNTAAAEPMHRSTLRPNGPLSRRSARN